MIRLRNSGIATLILLLPAALSANVTGTNVTVNSGQTVNLESSSGSVGSGGGDILFTGTGISFQTSAKGIAIPGQSGASTFNSLVSIGASGFSAFSSAFSSSSITPLTNGEIIAYKTNAGNTGALLINSVSSSSMNIQFVTFETGSGSGGGGGPVITSVLNNYGLISSGFANSGIALGSLFIIKGSGMASATSVSSLQSSAAGLPTTLNGASVSVTVNGTTTHPVFYYAEDIQLALVMPSNTPTGTGTVTVTYNGQTSNAFNITVVSNGFNFATYYGNGSGLGIATNVNTGAFYNYTNSIPPGTTVVLWGSGLGGDATRDTTFSTANIASIPGLSAIYVGGVRATIQYQGPSGYPGVNQINVLIDPSTPTGCFVSVTGVTAGGAQAGMTTNFMTLPIGTGTCSDPALGYSSSLVNSVNSNANFKNGYTFMLYSVTDGQTPLTEAAASFLNYSFSSFTNQAKIVSVGGCYVEENDSSSALSAATGLDAGSISVTSPNSVSPNPVNLASLASFLPGFYGSVNTSTGASTLPAGFLTQAGGTFTFAGAGGKDVGAFNSSLTFPTPLMTWTNASITSVTRSQGATVTWSGGAPGTYVTITGSATSTNYTGSFTCLAPVAPGTFTVPPYIVSTVPAANGSMTVSNSTVPNPFTATGLDYGYSVGIVTYTNSSVTYK